MYVCLFCQSRRKQNEGSVTAILSLIIEDKAIAWGKKKVKETICLLITPLHKKMCKITLDDIYFSISNTGMWIKTVSVVELQAPLRLVKL